ncbi:MAG: GIY-YIG nuclease family protein [Patescibacteria group bacterium]
MALNKEQILEEIKRTANENGGRPLGMNRFEKETGIKPYDWQRYWTQFSKAQLEAGFSPNQLQVAYSDRILFERIISLARQLNKFPNSREIRMEKINNPEFPDYGAFTRAFGSKEQFALKLAEYCNTKSGYEDIVEFCEEVSGKTNEKEEVDSKKILGSVYLFKHGRYYKIGKTSDTVRRGNELKIQLPEDLDLIHEIKTDDPSGVEAYWHRRFEDKRMNGEWFDLNSADIRAFKSWRRIV